MQRRMKVQSETVMKPLWKFRQYGESGRHVSELFPEITRHVDDLCFIKSMHTEGVAHGPSTLFLHTGATNLIRPSVGSWITYGLGSENSSLPGFVTISPTSAKGGASTLFQCVSASCLSRDSLGTCRAAGSTSQLRKCTATEERERSPAETDGTPPKSQPRTSKSRS